MRKLAVSASKKQRRRLTEYRFEEKFSEALQALGVKSHHACPDWDPGIMDRYVCGGGTWIEFKSLGYHRSVMPWNAFAQVQRDKLDEHTAQGDDVWVCVLLCHEDDGDDDRVILRKWPEFKEQYHKVSLPREWIIERLPVINRRDIEGMKKFIHLNFLIHRACALPF
jgi:hypothetical protein